MAALLCHGQCGVLLDWRPVGLLRLHLLGRQVLQPREYASAEGHVGTDQGTPCCALELWICPQLKSRLLVLPIGLVFCP